MLDIADVAGQSAKHPCPHVISEPEQLATRPIPTCGLHWATLFCGIGENVVSALEKGDEIRLQPILDIIQQTARQLNKVVVMTIVGDKQPTKIYGPGGRTYIEISKDTMKHMFTSEPVQHPIRDKLLLRT